MKALTTKIEVPRLSRLGDGAAEDYESGPPEVFRPSGLPPLDRMILGVVAGEVTLIAGAPGQGKTALAIQWALYTAQEGHKSAILSMEMGRRALLNRLISGLTGVPTEVLRTRAWADAKQKKLVLEAAEYINSIPLYVDDSSGLNAEKVYQSISSWKDQGVGLGIIDYIQQMSGVNESRVTQVGDAVRAIKNAAKHTDLPIIAISAINRNAANADNRPPRLSDLRDSGDLEFVSDTVLMFHYPEEDRNEDVRICDIHVMKQRNGPTGIASVKFNKPGTRFEII